MLPLQRPLSSDDCPEVCRVVMSADTLHLWDDKPWTLDLAPDLYDRIEDHQTGSPTWSEGRFERPAPTFAPVNGHFLLPPDGFEELQELWMNHAIFNGRGHEPTHWIHTWYINGFYAFTCRHPRRVQLDAHA